MGRTETVRPKMTQLDLGEPGADEGMTGETDDRIEIVADRWEEGDPPVDGREPSRGRGEEHSEQRMHVAGEPAVHRCAGSTLCFQLSHASKVSLDMNRCSFANLVPTSSSAALARR